MARARRLTMQVAVALVVVLLTACGTAVGDPVADDHRGQGEATGPVGAPAGPPPEAPQEPAAAGVQAQGEEQSSQAQQHPPPQPREPERPVAGVADVEIPKIGVSAPLIALGLNADRTMQVPTRRGVAGWYEYSPAPGAPGPAIIAGHVTLQGSPDVFYRLVELEPGDVATVRYRDGTTVTFEVYEVEQHPKDDFPTDRVYGNTDGPELRLITCGGEFDRSQRSYRDNIIAFARIISA